MVGLAFSNFVVSFMVFQKVVFSERTQSYFHVMNSETTNEQLTGFSCISSIHCASICAKEKCCSAKFNEQEKLCFLTPSANCFDELPQAIEDGWVAMMRVSMKKIFTMAMTWDDAKAFCISKGGRLATIRSAYEFDASVAMIKAQNILRTRVWIGGSDKQQEGVFVWDGTSEEVIMDVQYWLPNQPDNSRGDEHCLEFNDYYVAGDFKFDDNPCYMNYPFICEF